MKKLVLSAAFMAMAAFGAQAQVTITFKVDVTNYLAGGATVGANGFRVGGNFADQAGTRRSGFHGSPGKAPRCGGLAATLRRPDLL